VEELLRHDRRPQPRLRECDPLTGLESTATGGDALVRCGVPLLGLQVAPSTLTLRVGKRKKVKAWLELSK
jgi:hypothetical protein